MLHTTKNGLSPYSDAISIRIKIVEIIISAILVAISLTLLSQMKVYSFLSGALLFVTSLYWIYREFFKKIFSKKLSGFFIYNTITNKLIQVPNYGYSENLGRYLKAAFLENNNITELWVEEPLKNIKSHFQNSISKGKIAIPRIGSIKLIREATEYFIIEKLNNFLEDYYNLKPRKDIDSLKLRKIELKKMDNPFLNIFSNPLKNRPAFNNIYLYDNTVECATRLGHYYKNIKINLPNKSSIYKNKDGFITIETPICKINFLVDFNGINTNLPDYFESEYLSLKNENEYEIFYVGINIDININFSAFIFKRRMESIEWIDEYLNNLICTFSKDKLFQKLNWTAISTLLYLNKKK